MQKSRENWWKCVLEGDPDWARRQFSQGVPCQIHLQLVYRKDDEHGFRINPFCSRFVKQKAIYKADIRSGLACAFEQGPHRFRSVLVM